MEKVLLSAIRQHLIERHVPKEPVDPLVLKFTAFYWLLQELVGNWKAGRRLTLDQKAQLVQLLVWNLSRVQQEQAAYEAFTEDAVDVALCETSDEEDYETSISSETTEQIAQLVLACKELELNFSKSAREID